MDKQIQILEQRLASVENSTMFRAARWLGGTVAGWRNRLAPASNELAIPAEWYREYEEVEPEPPKTTLLEGYELITGPDDLINVSTTQWLADAARRTGASLIYSDHHSGHPVFKPGWSPELLACCDYIGTTYLKAKRDKGTVAHVPRVLWSTRNPPPSYSPPTSSGPFPKASIVVCSRNEKLLRTCLRSLERTRYPDWEVMAVIHHIGASMAERVRNVPYAGPFHWSRMNNLAVRESVGDLVVMLNDDVTVIEPDWLTLLAHHAMRPEIGAVGAKLVYPNGSIQHAGVVLGMMDGCGHAGRGQFATPVWPFTNMTRNVSAVTGACMAVRREVFDKLGGFDDAFPVNYNDVDFCLRAIDAGYRNVFEPRALLRHDECRTRRKGTLPGERAEFRKRWGSRLDAPDPYYPIMFRDDTEAIALRPVLEIERLLRG